MTILRILNYPDPRLKNIAKPVENIQEAAVQRQIDDMLETLTNTPHCGGLASTQLDIQNPYRIFVFYDFDESISSPQVATVAVNPEIISTEGEVCEEEGCMSVYPDFIQVKIVRPAKTNMRCLDREGKSVEFIRTGYLAKNFMHETDHLNGKLCIDHLKPVKRSIIDAKIEKTKHTLNKPKGV